MNDRTTLRRRQMLVALLASAAGSRAVGAERLVMTGSSTIAPLALEMAKRYERLFPGVRIDVQSGGSSRGVVDVRKGLAQVGMVSRALRSDESDLVGHVIAKDGIALIVHRSNPVAELSAAQVQAIYSGALRDWSAVGGPKGRITVVNKAEGRSTLELFLQHFGMKANDVRADVVIGENQQGIKTVASIPTALGYVSIGTAETEAQLGAPIRLLPLGGVPASTASVRDGTYPLSRPLNLVTAGAPSRLAREFIAFAQSTAVRDLVQASYFVPLAAR